MKKSSKGFTLVEILVTVSILALITIIAVPSVISINKKVKQKMLDTKISQAEEAVILWAQNNRNCILKENGGTSCVVKSGDCKDFEKDGKVNKNILVCSVSLNTLASNNIIKYDDDNYKEIINPVTNLDMKSTIINFIYNLKTKVFNSYNYELIENETSSKTTAERTAKVTKTNPRTDPRTDPIEKPTKPTNTLEDIIKNNHKIEDPKTKPGLEPSAKDEAVLAATKDDYGTSYYFRGNVKDNYVIFANKCWRIVRITGNGAVKLVLHNDNTNGVENPCASVNNDSAAAFAKYSSANYKANFNSYNIAGDNASIGFMYGTVSKNTFAETQANNNKSYMLEYLETWYKKYFLNKEYEKVLANTIWCNDKSVVSNTDYQALDSSSSFTIGRNYGIGSNYNYYNPAIRIIKNYNTLEGNPSLVCPTLYINGLDKNLSKFTVKDEKYGNGKLLYKVGLLTSDEIAYAGAVWGKSNTTYYLYENAYSDMWWTLSPFAKNSMGGAMFTISTSGNISYDTVHYSNALRPAVSLVSGTTIISGTGTSSNPFIISNSTTTPTPTPAPTTPTPKQENSLNNVIRKKHNIEDPKTTPGKQISNATEAVLAAAPDDYGTSYYFRGNVKDNYVIFANKCWRIVRITGNGAVKLVLHNDNTNGVENPCASVNNDSAAAFAKYSSANYKANFNSYNIAGDNASIGFMYGTVSKNTFAETQANNNKSYMLEYLETWYKKYFLNKEYEKVLANTIWCNDKSVVSNTDYQALDSSSSFTIGRNYGIGSNYNYYNPAIRIIKNYNTLEGNPSLVCPTLYINGLDKNLSKFTVKDEKYGNGKLLYKVGLLTSDEIAYAGAVWGKSNTTYYLYENAYSDMWWTLSPFAKNSMGGAMFTISTSGNISYDTVHYSNALRPAVSLVADVKISGGTGTSSDPFVIVGS